MVWGATKKGKCPPGRGSASPHQDPNPFPTTVIFGPQKRPQRARLTLRIRAPNITADGSGGCGHVRWCEGPSNVKRARCESRIEPWSCIHDPGREGVREHVWCDKCELSAAARASPCSFREPTHSVSMRAKHVQRDIDTKGLSVHLLSTCGALPLTSAVGTESAESDEEHLFERASDSSRAAKRRRGPDAIACDGGEHRRRPRRPQRAWRSASRARSKGAEDWRSARLLPVLGRSPQKSCASKTVFARC